LKGLGEELSQEENSLIEKTNSISLQEFIKVSSSSDSKAKLLDLASNIIQKEQTGV